MNILFFVMNNKPVLIILLLALILVLTLLLPEKKITLKKKQVKESKVLKILVLIAERIDFLKSLRDRLTKDLGLLTQKSSKTNIRYANNIVAALMVSFVISTILCFIFIDYIMLDIFLPFIILFLLVFLLQRQINKRRNKAKREFPDVVSVFTTQYAVTLNVVKALQRSIYTISQTHKYEFSRLLGALQGKEDYIKALDEYASRIDYPVCYIFVEILKINYVRNDNIIFALLDLENHMANEKKSELQRTNKLKDKKLNLYFSGASMIGAFAIDSFLLGEFASNFYFNTFTGQMITLASFALLATVFITMYILEKSI